MPLHLHLDSYRVGRCQETRSQEENLVETSETRTGGQRRDPRATTEPPTHFRYKRDNSHGIQDFQRHLFHGKLED